MTSLSSAVPRTSSARKRPAVHEPSARVHLLPMYSPNFLSNSWVLGPVPNHPDLNVFETSSISGSKIRGLPKIKKSFLTGLPPSIASLLRITFPFSQSHCLVLHA